MSDTDITIAFEHLGDENRARRCCEIELTWMALCPELERQWCCASCYILPSNTAVPLLSQARAKRLDLRFDNTIAHHDSCSRRKSGMAVQPTD